MSASLSSSSSGFAGEVLRRPSEDHLHVLAVDDNSVDRMLIEKLLKRLSCRVTTVESGKRALEVLENQKNLPVNVIFTDYCMPEVTGYDLLKRVKESSALRGIPVVLMSSENNPTRISRCLEGGAEEFLLKPVSQLDVRRLHDRFMRTN